MFECVCLYTCSVNECVLREEKWELKMSGNEIQLTFSSMWLTWLIFMPLLGRAMPSHWQHTCSITQSISHQSKPKWFPRSTGRTTSSKCKRRVKPTVITTNAFFIHFFRYTKRKTQGNLRSIQPNWSLTNPCDLLCACESMLLKVLGKVDKGVFLQVLAVAEDDQQTLFLHTHRQEGKMIQYTSYKIYFDK